MTVNEVIDLAKQKTIENIQEKKPKGRNIDEFYKIMR